MTPCSAVYDIFFLTATDDMFAECSREEAQQDCLGILQEAIVLFEFPREVIEVARFGTEFVFNRDLTYEEQSILATGMHVIWMRRQIYTIELTRQKFSGPDFKQTSQNAHLKTLTSLLTKTEETMKAAIMRYSRHEVRDGKWVSTFGDIVKRPRR